MNDRGRKWLKILCISLLVFFLVIVIYLMAGGTQTADVYNTYNALVEQNSGQGTVDKKLMFVAAYVKVTGDVTIAQRLGYDQQTIEEVINPTDPEPDEPENPSDSEVIDGFPNGLTIVTDSSTNFGYSDVRGLAALISQHYYKGNGNSFDGTYSHPSQPKRADNINHGNSSPSYHVNAATPSDGSVYIYCTVTYESNSTAARQDCSGSTTALHRLLGFNCPICSTSGMQSTLTAKGYMVVGDGNLSCSLLQVGDLIVKPGSHVEMVVYKDSTTVYTAGWGGDGSIESIYKVGYNNTASINGKASDLNSGASIVLRCP